MKNKKYSKSRIIKILAKFIYIVLILWFMISILRTGYNYTKIFTDKDYLSYPIRAKKLKYFGINQLLVERLTLDNNINKVLLLNEEGTISYFYLRYNLYPKEIFKRLDDINYDAIIIFETNNKKPNISSLLLKNYPKIEKIKFEGKVKAYLYTK